MVPAAILPRSRRVATAADVGHIWLTDWLKAAAAVAFIRSPQYHFRSSGNGRPPLIILILN